MQPGSRILEERFCRRLDWVEQEDGRAVVLRPRFGESSLARKLASLLGLSDYRIRLDRIGTLVWKQCDGERTAREIVGLLREEFGEQVEPAEERLSTFLAQMSRARMIEVRSSREP